MEKKRGWKIGFITLIAFNRFPIGFECNWPRRRSDRRFDRSWEGRSGKPGDFSRLRFVRGRVSAHHASSVWHEVELGRTELASFRKISDLLVREPVSPKRDYPRADGWN